MELGDEFDWEPYDPNLPGHEAPPGTVEECPGHDDGDDSDLPPELQRALLLDALDDGEGS